MMTNKEQENTEKLRKIMLGALYKVGDPKHEESLLDAWKLSNFYIHIYPIYI